MTDGGRLGPIRLQPDVQVSHLLTLFFAAFMTIGLLTFVALATPYVLTVSLGIPRSAQGAISGDLHVLQEAATLIAFGPIGIIADRIGRRQVYVVGMLLMGAGYAVYSYASTVTELVAYRLVYAVGVAAATAMRYTRRLQAGVTWVNVTARHYIGAPFGGWKNSGLGVEECLAELLSYTRAKAVHMFPA